MRINLLILSAAVVGGCAQHANSTLEYTPPKKGQIQNELHTESGFDKVWDDLVRELAKGFYVINNIAKESRIINVSFTTDRPEDFIDCGTSRRVLTRGKNETVYEYPVAGSNTYKEARGRAGMWGNFQVVATVQRVSTLEGRANIYVAPEGGGTRVTVNCRYVFSVTTNGVASAFNPFGLIVMQEPLAQSASTATFNTNQQAVVKNWGGPVGCQSTGKLEQEILSMVPR